MKTLIISDYDVPGKAVADFSYEVQQLLTKSEAYFEKVHFVNPNQINVVVRPSMHSIELYHQKTNISTANALIVRNTQGCEESTRLLAQSLYNRGCELLDPIERFNGSTAGKASMSIKGFKDHSLPDTYISYTLENALYTLNNLVSPHQFPLVGKPTVGCQGKDVEFLPNKTQAIGYAEDFFSSNAPKVRGIIFQKYIEIETEYRAVLLDGELLGMAQKHSHSNGFGRNAARGSVFTAGHDDHVEEFAKKHSEQRGLLGIDVALDRNHAIYIIEANRSPQWKAFEQATNIDVADRIFKALEKRMAVSSELF